MTEKIRWIPTYFGGIRQGRNDGVVSYIAFGRQNSMKRDKVGKSRRNERGRTLEKVTDYWPVRGEGHNALPSIH